MSLHSLQVETNLHNLLGPQEKWQNMKCVVTHPKMRHPKMLDMKQSSVLERSLSVHGALPSTPNFREKIHINCKTGFQYAAPVGLKLVILLPWFPGCWNYRHMSVCPAPLTIILWKIQDFLHFTMENNHVPCLYVHVITKCVLDDGHSSDTVHFLGLSEEFQEA